jgi:hypothetical protein
MIKTTLSFVIIFLVSCTTTKKFQIPMTDDMYQSTKKNYLKNYTEKFVNSIPNNDLKLTITDTILITYDVGTIR